MKGGNGRDFIPFKVPPLKRLVAQRKLAMASIPMSNLSRGYCLLRETPAMARNPSVKRCQMLAKAEHLTLPKQ